MVEISPGATLLIRSRGRKCDGGSGAGARGRGIDRRKHTRSKRQEAINESTQYTGFIKRLGDDEAWRRGGRGGRKVRNYAGIDDQRRKKFEGEVATGGRGRSVF